jgi:hypothetical protein
MRGLRVLAVAAAAAALTACTSGSPGGSGGGSPGASTTATASATSDPAAPSASPSPSTSPNLADASADEILAQARDAFLAAPSVHAKGAVPASGSTYTLDLRLAKDRGATGTIRSATGVITVIRIGSAAYVALDAASLRAATGSADAVRRYAGKYFTVTSSNRDSFAPFLALTDAGQAFGPALAPTGAVSKGSITTVNGHRAIDLLVDGGSGGDVQVALDGPPYPLRIGYGKGGPHVDLDGYGANVPLARPPASQMAPTSGR